LVRGHLSEGRRWLEDALARDEQAPAYLRTKALLGLAQLARAQGDFERAEVSCKVSLSLCRESRDDRGVSLTLTELGTINNIQGDDRAESLLQEALKLHRKMGNTHGTENVLNQLALLAYDAGNHERAIALWEEAMDSARDRGDVRQTSIIVNNLGWTMVLHGNHERGAPLLEESRAAASKLGDRQGLGVSVLNLGVAEMQRGDHGRAETLLREGLWLARELGDKAIITEALEHLAGVSGARGRAEEAARLYGAAEILRESLKAPLPPSERSFYERHLAVAHGQLDQSAWEEAWREGRYMTLEQAVSYALDEETESKG
jgi:tetratricopeptide (TPR) repeat protein